MRRRCGTQRAAPLLLVPKEGCFFLRPAMEIRKVSSAWVKAGVVRVAAKCSATCSWESGSHWMALVEGGFSPSGMICRHLRNRDRFRRVSGTLRFRLRNVWLAVAEYCRCPAADSQSSCGRVRPCMVRWLAEGAWTVKSDALMAKPTMFHRNEVHAHPAR